MTSAYNPTYSSLILETQDICENTNSEFVANIPLFAQRGQDQIQRDLALDFWRTYQTSTPISTASYARDGNWLIVRSLYLPTLNKWIEKRHIDYVRAYGGAAGRPRVWAEDQETTLLVAPTPDISYPLTVEAYTRLPPLVVGSNEQNWITKNVGDLLLLQILINASMYLVAPERAQEFATTYQELLPIAQAEVRDSERQRDQPIRSAARPIPGKARASA
jgi:hypothetical protein